MPDWLKWIAHVNPLTYEVDGLRALMLGGGGSSLGLGLDFTVLTVTLAVLVAWAGKMYPRIVV
jgi:ABC-2 type transport system permease protein